MKTVSKINEDLYKLLELGKINKIIRHYKIIKKNFNNDDVDIIFYQIPRADLEPSGNNNDHYSYDNIFYSKPSNIIDNYYNRNLDIDESYTSIQELKDNIDIEKNKAYDDFLNDVTNNDFTTEEINELNNVVNNYNNDHYYIRLYPYDDNNRTYYEWKKLLIDHFLNIINKEYLNNVKDKEAFYKENDMPGYSDIILYSESKYDAVKNIEDNEFKDDEQFRILTRDKIKNM